MNNIPLLTSSPSPSAMHKLNESIKAVNRLNNLVGDGIIKVNKTTAGVSLALDIGQVAARMPKIFGTSAQVRKAFCKNAAGAATTIDCYLDTDGTGEEVTVSFNIAGGGNCDKAIPRMADGTPIFVRDVGGTWECVTTLQAIDENKGLYITSGKLAVKVVAPITVGAGGVDIDVDTTKGLEVTGSKLAAKIDTAKGIEFDGDGEIAANINTDHFEFVTGEISSKLDEC
tara:strand:+ start:1160 stop:1843 length:684 start_codon:yes stop_codon:yes gene_type:complete